MARSQFSHWTAKSFDELLPGRCLRDRKSERRGSEGFDAGGHIGFRGDATHQSEHFALCPMLGEGEQLAVVFFGEVRTQQQQGRQVDFAGGDLLEDHRKLSTKPRSPGAPEGGVFG